MEKPQRNPGVALWSLVLVALALGYPLSFPPVCRFVWGGLVPSEVADATYRFYRPLLQKAYQNEKPWKEYANLWGLDDGQIQLMVVALYLGDAARAIDARHASLPK